MSPFFLSFILSFFPRSFVASWLDTDTGRQAVQYGPLAARQQQQPQFSSATTSSLNVVPLQSVSVFWSGLLCAVLCALRLQLPICECSLPRLRTAAAWQETDHVCREQAGRQHHSVSVFRFLRLPAAAVCSGEDGAVIYSKERPFPSTTPCGQWWPLLLVLPCRFCRSLFAPLSN